MNAPSPSVAEATRGLVMLDNAVYGTVEQIEPSPFQPRVIFDEEKLRELAENIREKGLDYPVLVRPIVPYLKNGNLIRFQLVDGERRWRSHQLIERSQIPMLVQELSDIEAQEKALDANIKDESFTDSEEANALKNLWLAYEKNEGVVMSFREMARRRKVSVTFVSNRMNLVGWGEKAGYHPDVQEMAARHRGVISLAALINPLPEERREKYIEMKDADPSLSYERVKSAIEIENAEIELKKQSKQAPDAETQERSNAQSRGESSGMSRGKRTKGPSKAEANLEALRATKTLIAWVEHCDEKTFKIIQDECRRVVRGDLAR